MPARSPLLSACSLLPPTPRAGLQDENQKVKTITALTISALAEASAPYGIESFDDVLEPLWKGIRLLRGKARVQGASRRGSRLLVAPAVVCAC